MTAVAAQLILIVVVQVAQVLIAGWKTKLGANTARLLKATRPSYLVQGETLVTRALWVTSITAILLYPAKQTRAPVQLRMRVVEPRFSITTNVTGLTSAVPSPTYDRAKLTRDC